MSSDLTQLEQHVRHAYERGRVHWALLGASLLFGFSSVCLGMAGRSWPFYLVALVLSTLAGVYIWRGGDSGNALVPGLVVSLIPLALSATMLHCGADCSGGCMQHCMSVCAVGSAAAGLLAAFLVRKHPRKQRAWLLAIALVPASGLLGCPHIGYGELGGLMAGLLIAKLCMRLPPQTSS